MIERPVSDGEFPTGTEFMLWRPGLDRGWLRRRTARAALLSVPALYAAFGVAIVAVGAHVGTATVSLMCVVLGSLIVTLNMVRIAVTHRSAEFDHRHRQDRPCVLDRTRGEFFYRPSDFTGLPPETTHSAHRIIESVRLIHGSPTAAWLDHQQLSDIHRVAWDALRVLDRTRALRDIIGDPRSDAHSAELAHVQSSVAAVDDAIDRILTCLDQAVLLTESWDRKLAEADVRARLHAELEMSTTTGSARLSAARNRYRKTFSPTSRPLATSPTLALRVGASTTMTIHFGRAWRALRVDDRGSATADMVLLMSTHSAPARRAGACPPDGLAWPLGRERRGRGWWVAWWRADRGSAAAEVTLVAPVLVMLLMFVAVVIHRGVDARMRLDDAAHQAARAASIERTPGAATAAAQSTASNALSSAGVTCASLTVDTTAGGLRPGGTVSVTISCSVDFGDALILGVPGQKRLSASAVEPVDTWRSTTVNTSGGTSGDES